MKLIIFIIFNLIQFCQWVCLFIFLFNLFLFLFVLTFALKEKFTHLGSFVTKFGVKEAMASKYFINFQYFLIHLQVPQMETCFSILYNSYQNGNTEHSVSSTQSSPKNLISSRLGYICSEEQREENEELKKWRQQTQYSILKVSAGQNLKNIDDQQEQFQFIDHFIPLDIGNLFYILQTLLTNLEIITQHFGYFLLTPKMLVIDLNAQFKFWVNEIFSRNFFQFPLNKLPQNQQQMVTNIIQIFQQRIPDDGIERDFLLQVNYQATNFIRFKQLIWEFSFENSILIPPSLIDSKINSSQFIAYSDQSFDQFDQETQEDEFRRNSEPAERKMFEQLKFSYDRRNFAKKEKKRKRVHFKSKKLQISPDQTAQNQFFSESQQLQDHPNQLEGLSIQIFQGSDLQKTKEWDGDNHYEPSEKDSQKSKFSFKKIQLKMNKMTNKLEKGGQFQAEVQATRANDNDNEKFIVNPRNKVKMKTNSSSQFLHQNQNRKRQGSKKNRTTLVQAHKSFKQIHIPAEKSSQKDPKLKQMEKKKEKQNKMKDYIRQKMEKNKIGKKILYLQQINTVKSIGDFTESQKKMQNDSRNSNCLQILGSMGRRIDKSEMWLHVELKEGQ